MLTFVANGYSARILYFSRCLSIKPGLLLMHCDVAHLPKYSTLSLHFSFGIQGHMQIFVQGKGEPGDEATVAIGFRSLGMRLL